VRDALTGGTGDLVSKDEIMRTARAGTVVEQRAGRGRGNGECPARLAPQAPVRRSIYRMARPMDQG